MRDDLDMANSDLTSLPAAGVGFPQASSPVPVGVLFQDVPGPGSRGSARRKGGDRPPAASGLVQPEVETRLLGQIARPQSEKGLRCFWRRAVVCKPGSNLQGSFMPRVRLEVLNGCQLERARSLFTVCLTFSSRDSNGDGVISDSRAGRETGRRDRTPFC